MKKFLVVTAGIFISLYILFFVFVYAFGDLNKYSCQIKTIVKDSVGLNFEAKNFKIKPTPKIELNLVADDLVLSYPDKKNILSVKNISVKLPVLPVILGDIKLSQIYIDSPEFDFSINNKGEIDLVKYLEPYIEKMSNQDTKEGAGLPKYFRISTNMPDIKIKNYKADVLDEPINQVISMSGSDLDIVKFDLNKGFKVITKGEVTSPKQKFADFDIAFDCFIPKFSDEKKENNKTGQYVDVFKNMIRYQFYTNVVADLKMIENKSDGINIKGDLKLKEFNLKAANINTKGTFADLKFNKNFVDMKSDFYLTKYQKAKVNANIKYGKKPEINVDVNSDRLELAYFLEIYKAICITLNIDNELSKLRVSGYVKPNFSVKSDMKTLKSNGYINLKDGKISHSSYPAKITDITSNINLDNNKITISDTKALINGQPITVDGVITQNADCDLKILSQNLSVKSLFEIFAGKNLKKSYKISSGTLNVDAKIKGKLEKIAPVVNVDVNNLSLTDKINHYKADLPNLKLKINTDLKKYNGELSVDALKIYFADYKTSGNLKNAKLTFDENDITLLPTSLNLSNSLIKLDGTIKNYAKSMNYEFNANGNISTLTIYSFVPKEYRSMVAKKGSLPLSAKISGDAKTLKATANISANSQNYITPVHITQLLNKPSNLKLDINTKGNELFINEVSLISSNTQFANIKGQILSYNGKNPTFKNIKIVTPNNLSFSIPNMQNSSVTLSSDLTVSGTMNSPKILGNINVAQVSMPSYKLNAKKIVVNLGSSAIKASSDYVSLAGSDLKFYMNANSDFSKKFVINSLNISSNTFDLGKILETFSSMPQNSNAPGTNIPLKIVSGTGAIKKLKFDNIIVNDCNSNFDFADNTLNLKNIKATAFRGSVSGTLSYNIQYLRMKTKLKGQNLNANAAMTTFTGLKDQMTGNLNFNANLSMAGSSARQQMQSLKGTVSFIVLDGQMGSLGKFEHFLYAENLLSQSIIKTTIGSVVSKLAPKNTGKFTKISGDIGLSNGWAQIAQVTTTGPNMSLYATGKYNLLTNLANINIYGKISEDVANSLGVVGELSIEKITSNIPKFGMTISKIFSTYNMTASSVNISKIPPLSTNANVGTKSFRVIINGDVSSTKSVKSFMWVISEEEAAQKRQELNSSSVMNDITNSVKKTMPTTQTTNTKNQTVEQTKTELKQTGTQMIQNQVNKALPGFLDSIGTQNSTTK